MFLWILQSSRFVTVQSVTSKEGKVAGINYLSGVRPRACVTSIVQAPRVALVPSSPHYM